MSKKDPLQTSLYFQSPVYHVEIPEWVKPIDKICDKYIKKAQKDNEKVIKQREKDWKKKVGDITMSHHSISMVGDPGLKEFQDYVGATSWNVMICLNTNYCGLNYGHNSFLKKVVDITWVTYIMIIIYLVFIF